MKPGLILSLLFLLSFGWLPSPIQSASPTATVAALLPGDDPCVYRPSVLRFSVIPTVVVAMLNLCLCSELLVIRPCSVM